LNKDSIKYVEMDSKTRIDLMTNIFFKQDTSKKERELEMVVRRVKEGEVSSKVKYLVKKLIKKDK
jgi:hypothetical protein